MKRTYKISIPKKEIPGLSEKEQASLDKYILGYEGIHTVEWNGRFFEYNRHGRGVQANFFEKERNFVLARKAGEMQKTTGSCASVDPCYFVCMNAALIEACMREFVPDLAESCMHESIVAAFAKAVSPGSRYSLVFDLSDPHPQMQAATAKEEPELMWYHNFTFELGPDLQNVASLKVRDTLIPISIEEIVDEKKPKAPGKQREKAVVSTH